MNGFRFAGIACGIKPDAKRDLALVVADEPAAIAAVFTTNRVRAAPVALSAAHLRRSGGRARAIVVNSGNANACTGPAGAEAAAQTVAAIARAVGCDDHEVLVASTGIIGRPLPAEKIIAAAPHLLRDARADGLDDFVHAIMTTDRFEKRAARTIELDGKTVQLLGCAKGAGMIAPAMKAAKTEATTLAFVFTDAAVAPNFLQAALGRAIDHTFNVVSVDGDISTNDSAFLFASGSAGNAPLTSSAPFERALFEVLDELARAVVRDGEGAERVVTIEVAGAPDDHAAERVARQIGGSLLVKTALHGADPNWGRVLAAIGAVGLAIDHAHIDVQFDDVAIVKSSVGVGSSAEERTRQVMLRPEYTITVELHAGPGRARHVTCDLGHNYVTLNADYTS